MNKLIIILLFLLLCNCKAKTSSQNGKNSFFKEISDTIVASQLIPKGTSSTDYLEKEYFVINSMDTSSFSCIISENKITKNLSMQYRYTPYQKVSALFSKEDTAVIAKEFMKKENHKLVYKEQIKEFSLILNSMSKDYDLTKLKNLRLSISSINGFSQSIVENYFNKYKTKINYSNSGKITDIIKNSQLAIDLNNLLLHYSMSVNKISIDGLIYYKPQSSHSSKQTLDGIVIFNLKPFP